MSEAWLFWLYVLVVAIWQPVELWQGFALLVEHYFGFLGIPVCFAQVATVWWVENNEFKIQFMLALATSFRAPIHDRSTSSSRTDHVNGQIFPARIFSLGVSSNLVMFFPLGLLVAPSQH